MNMLCILPDWATSSNSARTWPNSVAHWKSKRSSLQQVNTDLNVSVKQFWLTFCIITEIIEQKDRLDGLTPKLQAVLEAAKPLQEHLGMPLDKIRNEHRRAGLLPDPLYLLYVNTDAYRRVYGNVSQFFCNRLSIHIWFQILISSWRLSARKKMQYNGNRYRTQRHWMWRTRRNLTRIDKKSRLVINYYLLFLSVPSECLLIYFYSSDQITK